MSSAPLKVFLFCSGVGILNRGIETFARECFDGLRGTPGLQLELFKGAGDDVPPSEHRIWCLPRTGTAASVLGRMIRRTPYTVEQLSSVLPVARRLWRTRPDVIFTSDGNLLLALRRASHLFGFKLPPVLFSNGGPVNPPFPLADHVQQVTPEGMEDALAAGEPPAKLSLVPYGVHVPSGDLDPITDEDRRALRLRLGLKDAGRRVLLSVGWVSRGHKRMDYVIDEVAALPATERPYVVLLGAIDEASPEIIALARQKLGENGFVARSVPPHEVTDYYRAADVFTLGSLREGFGRVYLEALVQGLPAIVHDYSTTRFLLGDEATYADFSKAGELAAALAAAMPAPDLSGAARARRRDHVRARFSWEVLAPAYLQMFQRTSAVRACS